MMASDGPLDERLERVRGAWSRPGVAEDLALVSVMEPFSLWSLYAGGPAELQRYAAGAPLLADDTMRLEFSAPRELHNRNAGENGATLLGLLAPDGGPGVIREATLDRRGGPVAQSRRDDGEVGRSRARLRRLPARVGTGRHRSRRARWLRADRGADHSGGGGAHLVAHVVGARTDAATPAGEGHDLADGGARVRIAVAISKLQAASGAAESAVETARQASRQAPGDTGALEQLATLFADSGNTVQLDAAVTSLQALAPERAPTLYFAAVAAFLHGNPEEAVRLAERAVAADPGYAPTYDLVGAAYTRLEKVDLARRAFERSLTFDAHDSSAYTNLGLLELAAGNQAAARAFLRRGAVVDAGLGDRQARARADALIRALPIEQRLDTTARRQPHGHRARLAPLREAAAEARSTRPHLRPRRPATRRLAGNSSRTLPRPRRGRCGRRRARAGASMT